MPSSFGQWLIVILALLVGLAGGWALWGRQKPAAVAPIVEGDPVVGLSPEEKATATIDTPRPDATLDAAPLPAAVVDEHAPHEVAAPPTPGDPAPAASHTAPVDDTPLGDRTPTDDVPTLDGTPTTVADDRPVPLTDLEDEPAAADRTLSDPTPTGVVTDGSTAPVPAPRTAVEDTPDPATARPEPTPADAEPTATGPAASDPAAERPTEPTAETAPEPAIPGDGADDAPTSPAPAPERTTPVVVDTDDTPAGVTPVVPTQRTDPDRAPEEDAATGQDEPADDFRRIQGVGPKIAAALQAAGIRTYRQLAELDEASLRDTVRAAGLRATASLATWPQQARVLAGAGAEATRVLPTPAGGDARD
ncbi:hypothetical protein [Micromonospora sp. WMMD987]|uniref:hypothetical protein n=1 Tax=Micromonospora sp. WMMD987 TaxID=3016089 RepID=UPI00249A8E03|nr:hypothetical protein [Micromonospora sp. WMMD987]WFE97928.1 hypothetical protein O7612_14080 [Micromonospora sp. WMMD987]